jgi:hypothetical protein
MEPQKPVKAPQMFIPPFDWSVNMVRGGFTIDEDGGIIMDVEHADVLPQELMRKMRGLVAWEWEDKYTTIGTPVAGYFFRVYFPAPTNEGNQDVGLATPTVVHPTTPGESVCLSNGSPHNKEEKMQGKNAASGESVCLSNGSPHNKEEKMQGKNAASGESVCLSKVSPHHEEEKTQGLNIANKYKATSDLSQGSLPIGGQSTYQGTKGDASAWGKNTQASGGTKQCYDAAGGEKQYGGRNVAAKQPFEMQASAFEDLRSDYGRAATGPVQRRFASSPADAEMRQGYAEYPELGRPGSSANQAKGGRRDNYNRVARETMEAGMTPKDFDDERAPQGDEEMARREQELESTQAAERKTAKAAQEAESFKAAQALQEQADEDERIDKARIASDEVYARTQADPPSPVVNGNNDAQHLCEGDKSLIITFSGKTGPGRSRTQRQRTVEERPYESEEAILHHSAQVAAEDIMDDFDRDFQHPPPTTSIGHLIKERLRLTIDQCRDIAFADYVPTFSQQHELLTRTKSAFTAGVVWHDYVAAIKAEMMYALRVNSYDNKLIKLVPFTFHAMSPYRCHQEKYWFVAIFSAIMKILKARVARALQESAQPMHEGRGGGPGPGGRDPQGGRGARNGGTDTSSRSSRMTNGTQNTSSSGEPKYHGSGYQGGYKRLAEGENADEDQSTEAADDLQEIVEIIDNTVAKRDDKDIALVNSQRKQICQWIDEGRNIAADNLECFVVSTAEKRKFSKLSLTDLQPDDIELIYDFQARLCGHGSKLDDVWKNYSSFPSLVLRCVVAGMPVSDKGFEIIMQAIEPKVKDATFVEKSNAYVPKQITRLCNDIRHCLQQESLLSNATGEAAHNGYASLLRRAQQASALTIGMDDAVYSIGKWRTPFAIMVGALTTLTEEPDIDTLEQRKKVCTWSEAVIRGLKDKHEKVPAMLDELKVLSNDPMNESVTFQYVQDIIKASSAPMYRTLIQVPATAIQTKYDSKYTQYDIGLSVVDVHTYTDDGWSVTRNARHTAVLYGTPLRLDAKRDVVMIPSDFKCPNAHTFMNVVVNEHHQTQIWLGNYVTTEVLCMTLRHRGVKTPEVHKIKPIRVQKSVKTKFSTDILQEHEVMDTSNSTSNSSSFQTSDDCDASTQKCIIKSQVRSSGTEPHGASSTTTEESDDSTSSSYGDVDEPEPAQLQALFESITALSSDKDTSTSIEQPTCLCSPCNGRVRDSQPSALPFNRRPAFQVKRRRQ